MYKIYCDETWTVNESSCQFPCYVFYGIMLDDKFEEEINNSINDFKREHGLTNNGELFEIKWEKVAKEWKNAKKRNQVSRYELLLDLYFTFMKSNKLSFAFMFLSKKDYSRVESSFLEIQSDNKHNFFFMLYFQFLYHTFIKNVIKSRPCQIYIDEHDLGSMERPYDINTLTSVLNHKIFQMLNPKHQTALDKSLATRLYESIQYIEMADSKTIPIIQLSDLCAGCVRYIVENQITLSDINTNQLPLFLEEKDEAVNERGQRELAFSFYRKLRSIHGYSDINLIKPSYHHRFQIFPIKFL